MASQHYSLTFDVKNGNLLSPEKIANAIIDLFDVSAEPVLYIVDEDHNICYEAQWRRAPSIVIREVGVRTG